MYLPFKLVWLFIVTVYAQVPLPSIPYQPPLASDGAIPSTNKPGQPNSQWSTLLGNLLYFYEAQRSGYLPPSNRVPWRNTSSLIDGRDAGLDLSGGYYDAGDYMKYTYPLSFALTSICWGAIDYGTGYDKAKQTPYLDATLRWGLDWLIQAHPQPDVLYVQVGDVNLDVNYWGGDQNIPTPRPSYRINATNPGTEIAASVSAAFSSCALLYANATLSTSASSASLGNATYALTLLTHSQQLLNLAINGTGGMQVYRYPNSGPGRGYSSRSYTDDITFATLWLSLAQNSIVLAQQADTLYTAFNLGNNLNGVFNWDSKTPAIPVLFTQIASLHPDLGIDISRWKSQAELYFDAIINRQSGSFTPGMSRYPSFCGLLYYDGDSDLASLNPALNAAILLFRYAPFASTPDKKESYLKMAKSQLDYTLGKNPMSAPYIVGSNPNSPQNPHSAPASGGSDIGQIDNSPPQVAHVLYGAVVGGPDKRDQFFDTRSDWVQTEVALDYTAPMLTLCSMSVLTDTNDPFFTSLQAGAYDARRPRNRRSCPTPNSACTEISELDMTGKIMLGTFVGVVGLVVVALEGYYIWLVWTHV